MAGIWSSYSDSTCKHHNVFRSVPKETYGCGVTFSFKLSADTPPDMHYAVPALQECCDKMGRSVMRIPGNTGCEMQFCYVPMVLSERTDVRGPPENITNCMAFVYEGDLPDGIGDKVANSGTWCVPRMYDTELLGSEVRDAVTAEMAPANWSSAAVDSEETVLSSSADFAASSTPTSTSGGGRSRCRGRSKGFGLGTWAITALVTLGMFVTL